MAVQLHDELGGAISGAVSSVGGAIRSLAIAKSIKGRKAEELENRYREAMEEAGASLSNAKEQKSGKDVFSGNSRKVTFSENASFSIPKERDFLNERAINEALGESAGALSDSNAQSVSKGTDKPSIAIKRPNFNRRYVYKARR